MNRTLDAAVALAHLSRCRTRVAAILVKNGQVIAASPNLVKGGSHDHYRVQSVHAEEAVLRIAGSHAKGRHVVRG